MLEETELSGVRCVRLTVTSRGPFFLGFGVPFRDPVLQGALAQLHLNVEHQVELYLWVQPIYVIL